LPYHEPEGNDQPARDKVFNIVINMNTVSQQLNDITYTLRMAVPSGYTDPTPSNIQLIYTGPYCVAAWYRYDPKLLQSGE